MVPKHKSPVKAPQVDSSTNTRLIKFAEATTQTDTIQALIVPSETITPNYLRDFDHIRDELIEIIFQELEFNLANEIVAKELVEKEAVQASLPIVVIDTPDKFTSSKENTPTIITDTCVIPDTCVPSKYNLLVIPDTLAMSNKETRNSSNQFSDLLLTAKLNTGGEKKSKKLLFKQRDRLPALEFLAKSANSNPNQNDSPETPNHLKKTTNFFMENNLIVVDTPQKSEDMINLKNFKELDATLSKSANRVEFVDSRVLENSNSRFVSFEVNDNRTFNNDKSRNVENTIAYEHSDINETTLDDDTNCENPEEEGTKGLKTSDTDSGTKTEMYAENEG